MLSRPVKCYLPVRSVPPTLSEPRSLKHIDGGSPPTAPDGATRADRSDRMQARISMVTLGVADLERSVRFYRDGLGLPTEGIVGQEFEHGAVAFFDLMGGVRLALWARRDLAHDTGLPSSAAGDPPACSFGHNVRSAEEVDRVMELAARAGATVVKAPAPTFWGGYAAYFRDPDGHLWEVVHNPAWPDPPSP